MRYPDVTVTVRRTEPSGLRDDGTYDVVEKVEIDGEPWPVVACSWEVTNDRGGPIITLRVRGRLRIVEAE